MLTRNIFRGHDRFGEFEEPPKIKIPPRTHLSITMMTHTRSRSGETVLTKTFELPSKMFVFMMVLRLMRKKDPPDAEAHKPMMMMIMMARHQSGMHTVPNNAVQYDCAAGQDKGQEKKEGPNWLLKKLKIDVKIDASERCYKARLAGERTRLIRSMSR